MTRLPLLADEYTLMYCSPDPATIYAYTPGILRLPTSRLIGTMDQGGPGVIHLPGPQATRGEGRHCWQGKVFTSDDGGQTWTHRLDFPFFHARPFQAGKACYVLGHAGDLMIIRSDDDGENWSAPVAFTQGQWWHQSACSVVYANNRVYLVMERLVGPPNRTKTATLAPVVMSAPVTTDLTDRSNWTFSEERTYIDLAADAGLLGVPFVPGRGMGPGWLEGNMVQFVDPTHPWHDPAGRTFYIWMRAANAPPNMACVAKASEQPNGTISIGLPTAPTGKPVAYLPCPGGHLKFFIQYDEPSQLFWLIASHAADSVTGPRERHRLALHFSKNCIDWQMAGLVTAGGAPGQARNYASLAIDGDDLLVLSRSGTPAARSAHDGDVITLHRVHRFRDLVY